MDLEMVARTIQLIIAPAVMITSCCIFGAGLLGHYSAIGERLRVTVRERVDLMRETEAGTRRRSERVEESGLIVRERLEDVDYQIPKLLRHHLLVRTSLAGILIAMIFYILDMFVIAFSVISNRSGLYSAIVVVFLLGVAFQLIGVLYSVFDTVMSHKIYSYEARHAMALEKSEPNHHWPETQRSER
ncbi:MAG: DUF2721 domain-containing protein [Anaerolineae bacterium]|nr:DUF2721 domain-containing protein [Anaerolineae bacterium]